MAIHDNPKSCTYCGTLNGGAAVRCGNCKNQLPELEQPVPNKIEFQGRAVGSQTVRGKFYTAERILYFGGIWSDWTISLTYLEVGLSDLKVMVADITEAESKGTD